MTLVHFHLADAEGRGLDGSVSLVPTRRVTVADAIRLPVAQTVKLDKGEATVEVMPSTTQWAWRASELVAGGIVRYVEVPDKESAEYSGLADVDPKTLDQSSETVAAWELVTRAAQGVLDRLGTIDDKIQSAAASADAAKASETVASQESAKAVWEKADGGTLIGIRSNDTVAIYPGVTVLVRLCGYEDASLVTMLNNLGLPLVFAATDRPY